MKIVNKRTSSTFAASTDINIQPFEPGAHSRILIIAPHPDDETLAAGGVIAAALKIGSQIRVIVATNGDASYATALTWGSHLITKENFKHIANMRQHESLNALTILGLSPEHVHFWGFPDRGLTELLRIEWDDRHPYHSRTTRLGNSQQASNGKLLPFSGPNLEMLIMNELLAYDPTTVIMPHPRDHHPDHSALADFMLHTVKQHCLRSQRPMPVLLAYWMWYRYKPGMIKKYLQNSASFHLEIDSTKEVNQRMILDPEIRAKKMQALRCYPSQKIPAGMIFRDVARNPYEIFSQLQPLT